MALEEILATKKKEVALRRRRTPIDAVLSRCTTATRSFHKAIVEGAPGFILELKHASPSAGVILPEAERAVVLDAYASHADAISVVTDETFFNGSLEHLDLARERTQVPLLCKDFILDPLQVAEARLHGADAVLLLLAAIDDSTWRECAALAARLGMDVLTEVHDESELLRADDLDARIVGINNRDLKTFRVDTGVVARLAPLARPGRTIVVESGIGSRADVRSLRRHADAFLVGTSILKHPQPEQAVRRLVYGLTKICGLTGAADASAAWKAGATHGGLLFEPSSARAVSVEKAAEIRRAAPLTWVGVFVDDKTTRIAETARAVPLDAVQLHGRETRREIDRLRELLPLTCEIWKAIHVDDLPPEVAGSGADRLLFDRTVHGRSGGTGKTFDWSLLDGLPGKEDAILAGGLEPHNAARAAATGVAGLDTSTGVESSPGRKDAELLRCFMRARRRIEGRRKVNR